MRLLLLCGGTLPLKLQFLLGMTLAILQFVRLSLLAAQPLFLQSLAVSVLLLLLEPLLLKRFLAFLSLLLLEPLLLVGAVRGLTVRLRLLGMRRLRRLTMRLLWVLLRSVLLLLFLLALFFQLLRRKRLSENDL
jgi:hypothetical protein